MYRESLKYCEKRYPSFCSILNIALDVHMTAMGSYDRHPEDEVHLADVKILKELLENWTEDNRQIRFQNAVKELIKAALEENEESYQQYLKLKERYNSNES